MSLLRRPAVGAAGADEVKEILRGHILLWPLSYLIGDCTDSRVLPQNVASAGTAALTADVVRGLFCVNMYDKTEHAENQPSSHVFREAEKRVQRRLRRKYGTGGKLVEEVVDLSDVVDLSKLAFDDGCGSSSHAVHRAGRWGDVLRVQRAVDGVNALVYSFDRHPGFYVVRHLLDEALASRMAEACLGDAVLRPPATTNFNKSHGLCMSGLWDAVTHNLRLVTGTNDAGSSTSPTRQDQTLKTTQWARGGTGRPASEFLASLRWASVGPCYDWTNRVYLKDQDHVPLPIDMMLFAKQVWALVGGQVGHSAGSGGDGGGRIHDGGGDGGGRIHDGGGNGGGNDGGHRDDLRAEYRPNAALINYYREGDKLCGHVDDAESDQTQPLVSISLGCPAIFLMGGENKDVVPTPMILRHGDAAVLSGAARRAYHGLPRIFPANREHPLVDPDGEPIWDPDARAFLGTSPLPACVLYSRERSAGTKPTSPVAQYLLDCRINVSIRQV